MNPKNIIFFILSILLGCLLAIHRWGDSSHVIGFISINGGKHRHPAVMKSGRGHYSQITTVTVLPPYSGDVKVLLEGTPPLDYEIYLSKPVIDLKIYSLPKLKENTLYNLNAGDRLALWTLIKSARQSNKDHKKIASSGSIHLAGCFDDVFYCLKNFLNFWNAGTAGYLHEFSVRGRYTLAFYDTSTGKSVLKIPMIFQTREQENERSQH